MNLSDESNLKTISLLTTLVNNSIKEEFKKRINEGKCIIGLREVLLVASDPKTLANGVAIQGTFDVDRELEQYPDVLAFLEGIGNRIKKLITPCVYDELIHEFATNTNYKDSLRYAETEFIKTKEFLHNNPSIFVLLFFNSRTLTPYLL